MKLDGWFRDDATHGGRTLAEQLLGLDAAIAEARGKTVLDLGCAEGDIARHFRRAGAASVDALEGKERFVRYARAQGIAGVRVGWVDLNAGLPTAYRGPYHVVLALAVLHKLENPPAALDWLVPAVGELLVVRLPHGSKGEIRSKHFEDNGSDLRVALPARGLRWAAEYPGPRGELVQYWRRA